MIASWRRHEGTCSPTGARVTAWGACALREFARLVAEQRPLLVLEHVTEREHIVDSERV